MPISTFKFWPMRPSAAPSLNRIDIAIQAYTLLTMPTYFAINLSNIQSVARACSPLLTFTSMSTLHKLPRNCFSFQHVNKDANHMLMRLKLFQRFVSVLFQDVRTPEMKQNFVSFQPTTGSIALFQFYFRRTHILK